MSLTDPKRKPHCRLPHDYPLPIILNNKNEVYKFKGVFNKFCIQIDDSDDVRKLVSMGYFGKANLSRSFPSFVTKGKTELLRERQFKRRKEWGKSASGKKQVKKVIVVPDSDSDKEIDDYLTNVSPRYEVDQSNIKENLWLGLEEAFFLQNGVKCLDVTLEGKQLSDNELWDVFSKTDPYFQENYLVYFYYRSKNWVVKPGFKFGGDFLLYKEGPPFYHASYLIIIDVLDHNLQRINTRVFRRKMDNIPILALNRLCETAGKELLICQIIIPEGDITINFNNLKDFQIREVTIKRWLAAQERHT